MKKLSAIVLAAALMLTSMTACSVNININGSTESTEATASQQTSDATETVTGKLSDYVRTSVENEVSFGDGVTKTLRLPEILLDSEDAKAANSDITEKFGADTDGKSGVNTLDYTAALNDNLLSVCVCAGFEGGNSGAEVFNFDVSTGKKVDNDVILKYKGVSYTDVIEKIEKALDDYYKERNFDKLPLNDDMKAKTFSARNLKDARLYLNDEGKIMCVADVYASVGGGHFVTNKELDI